MGDSSTNGATRMVLTGRPQRFRRLRENHHSVRLDIVKEEFRSTDERGVDLGKCDMFCTPPPDSRESSRGGLHARVAYQQARQLQTRVARGPTTATGSSFAIRPFSRILMHPVAYVCMKLPCGRQSENLGVACEIRMALIKTLSCTSANAQGKQRTWKTGFHEDA